MLLYKFVSSLDAAMHLIDGRLKFCPIDQLNDPSELASYVDPQQLIESRKNYLRTGFRPAEITMLQQQAAFLRRVAPEFQRAPAPRNSDEALKIISMAAFEHTPLLLEFFERLISTLRRQLGAFCVSQRYDSLAMWAHYAKNGQGFALEFSNLEDEFVGDSSGVLNRLIEISYSETPATVTFAPDSATRLFSWKFPDWGYERETRILLPISDCQRTPTEAGDLFIKTIPKRHLTRVIVGPSASDTDVQTVAKRLSASSTTRHAKVSRFVAKGIERRLIDLR